VSNLKITQLGDAAAGKNRYPIYKGSPAKFGNKEVRMHEDMWLLLQREKSSDMLRCSANERYINTGKGSPENLTVVSSRAILWFGRLLVNVGVQIQQNHGMRVDPATLKPNPVNN
jgi:hypothetical protein